MIATRVIFVVSFVFKICAIKFIFFLKIQLFIIMIYTCSIMKKIYASYVSRPFNVSASLYVYDILGILERFYHENCIISEWKVCILQHMYRIYASNCLIIFILHSMRHALYILIHCIALNVCWFSWNSPIL